MYISLNLARMLTLTESATCQRYKAYWIIFLDVKDWKKLILKKIGTVEIIFHLFPEYFVIF